MHNVALQMQSVCRLHAAQLPDILVHCANIKIAYIFLLFRCVDTTQEISFSWCGWRGTKESLSYRFWACAQCKVAVTMINFISSHQFKVVQESFRNPYSALFAQAITMNNMGKHMKWVSSGALDVSVCKCVARFHLLKCQSRPLTPDYLPNTTYDSNKPVCYMYDISIDRIASIDCFVVGLFCVVMTQSKTCSHGNSNRMLVVGMDTKLLQ